MIQTPPPALPQIPFDWLRFMDNDVMPLVAVIVVGVVVVLGLQVLMKSPVGEAWAERIRRKTREKYGEPGALSGEQTALQVEGLQNQLNRIEAQLADQNERIDFTERVLIKQKDSHPLGRP